MYEFPGLVHNNTCVDYGDITKNRMMIFDQIFKFFKVDQWRL